MDEGKAVDSVYLDFSNAFDNIFHNTVLEKLAAHGFYEQSLLGIKQFGWPGPGRWGMELHPGGSCSSVALPRAQLGQDLAKRIKCTCNQFVDDTELDRRADLLGSRKGLQRDLDSMDPWPEVQQGLALGSQQPHAALHAGRGVWRVAW